jgi:stage II sporulation protein R
VNIVTKNGNNFNINHFIRGWVIMKKFVLTSVAIIIIISIALNTNNISGKASQSDVAGKLIRFHVIANSDDKVDQELKLKVRDAVLEYVSPKLINSKSIEESRVIINSEDKNIKKVAQMVINKNGFKYSADTTLSEEYFPVKTYGNITLPQGEYEAYRILIGSGRGQNWWCVMFPPLCFVDITKGEVAFEETESDMKSVLSDEEYELIDNTKDNKEIIVKFKIMEILGGLFS